MFIVYNNLNEGGCSNSEKKCTDRKFYEGTNPKTTEQNIVNKKWTSSKPPVHVNSHWEKLRK